MDGAISIETTVACNSTECHSDISAAVNKPKALIDQSRPPLRGTERMDRLKMCTIGLGACV